MNDRFELVAGSCSASGVQLPTPLARMKITTWNVNGVRARSGQVHEWVLRESPDVLCLQEIKASAHQVPEDLVELPGYWNYWHGDGGYSGVSLHVRQSLSPVRPRFMHPDFDHECRIVVAELATLSVASIYVPNGGRGIADKMRFLERLDAFAASAIESGRDLLLCGDLNVALTPRDVHPKLENEKQVGQTGPERALLHRLIGRGVVDLLRQFHQNDDQLFTWWAPWRQHRDRNIGWRLDYVLASKRLSERAKRCDAERLFGDSDHGPVTALFEGPLFDNTKVEPGDAPAQPARAEQKPASPQLDLFG